MGAKGGQEVKTTLFVIRHAESQWNPIGRYQGLLNPDLSERGEKQAKILAKELKNKGIEVIYTSPLLRTKRTAQIIAEELNVPLIEDERVIEIDHGVWSGKLVEEVKKEFPEMFEMWITRPWKVDFPEGENLLKVFERVKDFIRFVKEKHKGQTVAVVSHTVPIRALYCAALELPIEKFWSFGCDNASYSIINFEEDRTTLHKLNITCHLEREGLYEEAHRAL
ncbi:MAG: histidine phosphatase family protein [Aquificae bacterium]|jgi:probable phosphoglycerate mutase|nr:histidine phosphatase family protein [Aquificota bacterium]